MLCSGCKKECTDYYSITNSMLAVFTLKNANDILCVSCMDKFLGKREEERNCTRNERT